MVAAALRDRQLPVSLAGRRLQRLQLYAAPGEECRVGSFSEVVKGMRVVINCAPLDLWESEALAGASLSAGAHFVDTGGEQASVRHLLDAFGAQASRAGLSLIPAAGFDYALGDCLVRVAAEGLEPCTEIEVAYAFGPGAEDASLNFAAAKRGPEVVYRQGRWQNVPFELDRGFVDFPPPFGRCQVGRYGGGEVVCGPRHTRTQALRTVIVASALVPHPALLPLFPVLRPLVTRLMATRLRSLVLWLARRLRPAQNANLTPPRFPPKGPNFAIVVEARNSSGSSRHVVATGPDCYSAGAQAVALCARELLLGKGRPGALSPAAAFPPRSFLEQLNPFVVCCGL